MAAFTPAFDGVRAHYYLYGGLDGTQQFLRALDQPVPVPVEIFFVVRIFFCFLQRRRSFLRLPHDDQR